MANVRKLSVADLKKIIVEERMKIGGGVKDVSKQAKKTKEYQPDDLGTDKVHEKHIDFQKALKIKEAKLLRSLKLVREAMKRNVLRARKLRESKGKVK